MPAYPPQNPAYPPTNPTMMPPNQFPQWNGPPPGQYPPGPAAPMVLLSSVCVGAELDASQMSACGTSVSETESFQCWCLFWDWMGDSAIVCVCVCAKGYMAAPVMYNAAPAPSSDQAKEEIQMENTASSPTDALLTAQVFKHTLLLFCE